MSVPIRCRRPRFFSISRQRVRAELRLPVDRLQIAAGARLQLDPTTTTQTMNRPKAGRVIYSEAFGVTDKDSATAATPRSVLQIGSVTKQFTAAAILRFAERGALALDDRIEKFVPEFDPREHDHTAAPPQPHVGSSSRLVPADGDRLAPPSAVTPERVITTLKAQPRLRPRR